MARPSKINLEDMFKGMGESLIQQSKQPNIKKYRPHDKQYRFHTSKAKRKLLIGGNRSGKTEGGTAEGIWRAASTHPYRSELNQMGPTNGRVIGVDFTQGVDKILIPKYSRLTYPSILRGGAWETAYDKGARTLNLTTGSTIEFMSYDQDLDKFAGTSRHWIHMDEEPPESIYGENLARLIDTNGDFWITMTPVDGITWIYEKLYEPNIKLPEDERRVDIIEISSFDNPFLSEEALTTFGEGLDDDEEISTRLGGGFIQQGGRVYPNFDPTVGGPHVLKEPISNPKDLFPSRNWMWIMSLDSGIKNPTSVHWYAVNQYGFVIVFDEWYKEGLTAKQHAPIIKKKIAEHGRFPDLLVADPSIKKRDASTGTSVHLEYQKQGLSFTFGNNDLRPGIDRVRTYFLPRLLSAGLGFEPHPLFPEANKEYPGIRISPNCEKMIWEGKLYRFKTYVNKKLNDERNPYEEPNPKNDHAMDDLRYALMTRPDLVASNNAMSNKKLDEVMQALEMKIQRDVSYDIADPFDSLDNFNKDDPDSWNPYSNSTSSTEWEFDEHMGGQY